MNPDAETPIPSGSWSNGTTQDVMDVNDEDILVKLTDLEDSFTERKTEGDSRDWLKTAVAFANSAPVNYPSVLFIGVKNDGTIAGIGNPDSTQRSLGEKLARAYPSIYYWTRVFEREGKQFLAVIIPGSENRPHFAGPAYVRQGSDSIPASEEKFREIIASRTDKARLILEWKAKLVTVHKLHTEHVMHSMGRVAYEQEMFVRDCNHFCVTLSESATEGSSCWSYPLRIVDISFDNVKARLALEIRPA